MDAQTILAILQSILHWERLSECTTQAQINREGLGYQNCALCRVFNTTKKEGACGNCPVYLKTRISDCGNTPYSGVISAYIKWEKADLLLKKNLTALAKVSIKNDIQSYKEAWKLCCSHEIKFLKNLLPADVSVQAYMDSHG